VPVVDGEAIDAGRCRRDARLADLRGVRPSADCPGKKALCRRQPGLELTNTVYALDSTTIDLCLSLFRSTKAAVKMHTLLDLRGNIPSFIHISDGKLHEFTPSICCSPKRAPSTSWIAATSICRPS
jgi:hypothetical protein